MPYAGAPSYYGAIGLQQNPTYGAYGVALPGGYDPSIKTLGMLAGGIYLATMLKNKGMAQKAIGAAGVYLAYMGGKKFVESKAMEAAVPPSAPAAVQVEAAVGNLMEEFSDSSTLHKALMVGGAGALIYYSGALKKLGIGKKRNGRRRNSRSRVRNSRRRNSRVRRNRSR